MKKILVLILLFFPSVVFANTPWYSTLQGAASDVEQTPPPNGVTIVYNTTDNMWEFSYALVPAGGATGTCLEKNSNSDYDYSWVSCSGSTNYWSLSGSTLAPTTSSWNVTTTGAVQGGTVTDGYTTLNSGSISSVNSGVQTNYNFNHCVTVSGTLSPNATGLYCSQGATYNASEVFVNSSLTYYIWWSASSPVSNAWILSTAPGTATNYWQGGGGGLNQTMGHHGSYTGTATVVSDQSGTSIESDNIFTHNIIDDNGCLGVNDYLNVYYVSGTVQAGATGQYDCYSDTTYNGVTYISYTNGLYNIAFSPSNYYLYNIAAGFTAGSLIGPASSAGGSYTYNSGSTWHSVYTVTRHYNTGIFDLNASLVVSDILGANVVQGNYFECGNGVYLEDNAKNFTNCLSYAVIDSAGDFNSSGGIVIGVGGIINNVGSGNSLTDSDGDLYWPNGDLLFDNNVTLTAEYPTNNESTWADESGGLYLSNVNNGDNGLFYDSSGSNGSPGSAGYIMYSGGASAGATWEPLIAGTGIGIVLASTGDTITSKAESTINFQPGFLSSVINTKGVYGKIVKASTVDNIIGSALSLTCTTNPTITMYECGTSATCASSPVTIGTVTVTASGTAFSGTVSNPAITAGDYVGWAITAGTCASIDIAGTAQIHSN